MPDKQVRDERRAKPPGGTREPPLVAHIVYRLDYGGLENGLVNIINRMPEGRYRHAIICLTRYSDFRKRIKRPDVQVFALDKREGKDLLAYWRLWRLLRRLRPAIVHTRNLAALDCVPVAFLAGVKGRVHGEHGRDIFDIDGQNKKYILLRRLCAPFVHTFIPMSRDLERWLERTVRIGTGKIRQIYNGVDTDRFHPPAGAREAPPDTAPADGGTFVIGTVGRMEPVKDPGTLIDAFAILVDAMGSAGARLRLVLVGDGPLRPALEQKVRDMGLATQVWFAGARNDVPAVLRRLDLFVLPSLAEGISNTILEAMASGLPVVATAVGGTPEIVSDGRTGTLVPPADAGEMARAMGRYAADRDLAQRHGREARARLENEFSLSEMVNRYLAVYDAVSTRTPMN